MSYSVTLALTDEDYAEAFGEVAFLVDSFCCTIDNVMGGATAPVGRIAGRDMARKMPIHIESHSMADVVAILAERMKGGFTMELNQISAHEGTLHFGRCVIRDVCSLRNVPVGGPICRLFHAYLDGVVDELTQCPTKSSITEAGDKCQIAVQVR